MANKPAAPHRMLAIRISPELHESLRRHAFERSVSAARLVNDILSIWCNAATDPTDPLFTGPMGAKLPALPNEDGTYPGYLDGLVFSVNG